MGRRRERACKLYLSKSRDQHEKRPGTVREAEVFGYARTVLTVKNSVKDTKGGI